MPDTPQPGSSCSNPPIRKDRRETRKTKKRIFAPSQSSCAPDKAEEQRQGDDEERRSNRGFFKLAGRVPGSQKSVQEPDSNASTKTGAMTEVKRSAMHERKRTERAVTWSVLSFETR